MATFIRGEAIPNASGYELRKKDGNSYILVGEKVVGSAKYDIPGIITTSGEILTRIQGYWNHTEMISVSDLADGSDGYCVKLNGNADAQNAKQTHIAYYKTKDDETSFVYCEGFAGANENHRTTITAEHIRQKAAEKGANYVAISSNTGSFEGEQGVPLEVHLKPTIDFNLADYKDKLSVGQTHTLVVRAIGDGVQYSNSEYSNEVEYTV